MDRGEAKQIYSDFCKRCYVQVYSKPWWMDVVCGPDNWDVWLYMSGGNVIAAMPYYHVERNGYKYITKPLLTQTNGIIFNNNPNASICAEAEMQEKIINAACEYIEGLDLDVYEQQFPYSFCNWQPFFWNRYTNTVRYTYVIEDTSCPENVMKSLSANYRKNVRKGQRTTSVFENDLSKSEFYAEHKKIYDKQGLPVPFSEAFWNELYDACIINNAGKILVARDENNNVHSLMFVVWDEKAMYPILGGYMPEYSSSQSYPALTYRSICMAGEMGLKYDFEGSMIKRIAHSFREYGGVPMPYYRIRKVFNPDLVRKEAEEVISFLAH